MLKSFSTKGIQVPLVYIDTERSGNVFLEMSGACWVADWETGEQTAPSSATALLAKVIRPLWLQAHSEPLPFCGYFRQSFH